MAMPGGILRSRPTPEGAPLTSLTSGAPVVLRSELKNIKGTWWYAEAGGQQGWIRETDLQPKMP